MAGPLANELDIAHSTLKWHLDRSVAQGRIEKQREDGRAILVAAALEATVRLLRDADPTAG